MSKTCEWCGKDFESRGVGQKRAKTCGRDCRIKRQMQIDRDRSRARYAATRASMTPEELAQQRQRDRDRMRASRHTQNRKERDRAKRLAEAEAIRLNPDGPLAKRRAEQRQKFAEYCRRRYANLSPEYRALRAKQAAEWRTRPENRQKAIERTAVWRRENHERYQAQMIEVRVRRRHAELLSFTASLTEQLNVRPETGNP